MHGQQNIKFQIKLQVIIIIVIIIIIKKLQ